MAKNLIATILVNFVLIPSIAGMKQHKLTWIVIKIFAINLYHHSHFLAALFDFITFSHWLFWAGPHLFLQPGCFWADNYKQKNFQILAGFFCYAEKHYSCNEALLCKTLGDNANPIRQWVNTHTHTHAHTHTHTHTCTHTHTHTHTHTLARMMATGRWHRY